MQLSPQRSFVVQFADDTQIRGQRIAGRVEHVVSHQTAPFDSLEALLTFIAQVLDEVEAPAPEGEPNM